MALLLNCKIRTKLSHSYHSDAFKTKGLLWVALFLLTLAHIMCSYLISQYLWHKHLSVTRATVYWISGGVCTVCPGCILMSACSLLCHCTSQKTDELNTVSVSQGPQVALHHPASGRATAVKTGTSSKCTSCLRWRPLGGSCGPWSTMTCSPADCPRLFSRSGLHLEDLFCPSGI